MRPRFLVSFVTLECYLFYIVINVLYGISCHISWWYNDMETFSTLLSLCVRNAHGRHQWVLLTNGKQCKYYNDVIMGTIASQITSLTTVYSAVYSDADQRKHQSSASLASVLGIHRGLVNSPHKWPVMRKMFPFDAVIIKIISPSWHHRVNWSSLI